MSVSSFESSSEMDLPNNYRQHITADSRIMNITDKNISKETSRSRISILTEDINDNEFKKSFKRASIRFIDSMDQLNIKDIKVIDKSRIYKWLTEWPLYRNTDPIK